jgi:hypothetical protein
MVPSFRGAFHVARTPENNTTKIEKARCGGA